MSSVHNITHSPDPKPAKKLRPSLSPARGCLRPSSPPMDVDGSRFPSASSSRSSSFSEGPDGVWYRRCKTVHWQGEVDGCVVTSCFDTYSASEYDRTPLAPPSEQERACVLPARGARCLSYLDDDDADSDHEEDDTAEASDTDTDDDDAPPRPSSPFASPEDSDLSGGEEDGDEWSACFARRRMMFARMSSFDRESAQPQFEGYRSLSATLVELLKSVGCDEDDEDTLSSTPGDDSGMSKLSTVSSNESIATVVFSRLHRSPEDEDADERETEPEIDTPSLVSSADSEVDCSIASPPCSRVEFVPPPIAWSRTALSYGAHQ